MTVQEALDLALTRHRSGKLAEAEGIYRQILTAQPDQPDALHLLGVLAFQAGRADVAAQLIERAITIKPEVAEYYVSLGSVLAKIGRIEQATAACRHALTARPDFADAHVAMGVCHQTSGDLDRAIDCFRHALKRQPEHVDARANLGAALLAKGELEEALVCLRQAVAAKPDFAYAQSNLANALKEDGQIDQALACFDRAIALAPNDASVASNRLYTLYFHPDCEAPAILHQHRSWADRFARPLSGGIRPHENSRAPRRRLRVGYVSPNFCMHSQAPFIVPLLTNHRDTEVYCYFDGIRSDVVTNRLRHCAAAWRSIAGMNDAAVAELIRNDRIDILVDLTLHMASGRPLLFARKPAPVQVAWLAYPGTTGMAAMDYRLTDAHLDPPGQADDDYTEISIRLPRTFACYQTLEDDLAVSPPPVEQNGYITFGSLNNFCKVNEPLLKLWSHVLRSVPSARMRLLAPAGKSRGRTLQAFAAHGVASERIEFVSRQPRAKYLAEYGKIDLCLDTLPYNGHTTSLDAMWMGVPVLSRVGRTAAGRIGASLMANLRLSELVCDDDDHFVNTAVQWAADVPRLAEMRRSIRDRLAASPIMDAPGFARDVESAFSDMWRKWTAETREGNQNQP